jgi:hypothetical protein
LGFGKIRSLTSMFRRLYACIEAHMRHRTND